MFRSIALSVSLAALAASPSFAQQPPAPPAAPAASPSAMFRAMVRSPEVSADGRITFRLRAPNAKAVIVNRAGAPPLAMTAGDEGVWTATTETLPPDIYPYNFVVDGLQIADPGNAFVKAVLPGGSQSLVHVPGPASLPWEIGTVPRGVVHHHYYKSAIVGDERDYYVYTPPGYDASKASTYPVLFLLHGITDDASAWTTAGRANVILDNLIAAGKATPMIMVNTLGYGVASARTSFQGMADPASMTNFGESVIREVLPQVEAAYRTTKAREGRAIVGLSMGGAQACYIGLNNADTFAWVAGFSGAYVMYGSSALPGAPRPPLDGSAFEKRFPALGPPVGAKLRLFWLGMGVDDGLLEPHRQFAAWLASKGVRPTTVETPGGHTWMVWRRNLAEVAPMLFQEKTR